MTTDNKTLADVQPGGRVRLGDQALRVFSAGRWTYDGTGQSFSHEEMDAAAFVVYRDAALSAQPSPGGQEDAVLRAINSKDLYQVLMDVQNGIDSPALASMANGAIQLIDKARSALAARQPVETQLGYTLSDVHEAYSRGKRDAERKPVGNYEIQTENGPLKCSLAVYAEWQKNEEYIARLEEELKSARQPVGVPDFFMVRDEDESRWRESDEATFDSVKRQRPDDAIALYTAPPAQAVDLGAVRALLQRRIEQWRSHLPADPGAPGTREIETKGEHDYNNDVRIYREGIAVMEEVLSKIDGQAVGK